MNKHVISYTIGAFLLIPLPGKSAETVINTKELYQLLQSQEKQLKSQQEQIEELRKLVLKQQTQSNKPLDTTDNKVKKIARSNTKVALNKKGLQIKSNNGDFSVKAGGRVHADFAHFDDDVTQMASGAILRRARIKLAGRLFRDWRYKAEIDFAKKGDVGAKAVWLSYTGWEYASFKLGHFKEPFSLEEMTSSNAITFMERALPNEFAPSYHLGFAASGYGDYWSLSGGLFGEGIGTKDDDDVDDGWGVVGRATLTPFYKPGQLLHLGFSSEYRRLDSNDEVKFRTRPESSATSRRLVNTGTIEDSDYTLKLNAEMAAVYGPFSLQGEYFHTRVDRNGLSDLIFDGSYVYASYFITGESRPYSVSDGKFLPVDPLNQYGAWELAFRYSTIDLDDHDIHGGKQDNYTLGLNQGNRV